jgi:hypothetical protein
MQWLHYTDLICLLTKFSTSYPTRSRRAFLGVNQSAVLFRLFKLQTHPYLLWAHHKQARREGIRAHTECTVNEYYSFLTDIIYVGFHSPVLQISGPIFWDPTQRKVPPAPPKPVLHDPSRCIHNICNTTRWALMDTVRNTFYNRKMLAKNARSVVAVRPKSIC